jgi:polyisoprenoid-binding protein YceI
VKHLKSEDFFSVEEYPEANIEITNIKHAGAGKYNIEADLTIRGITKPISFETFQTGKADSPSFAAKLTIERTQYEVMYGWKIENAMLGGEFDLEVNLVTAK